MQDRSRRQLIAVAISLIWLALLALAIFGRNSKVIPPWATVLAAVISLGSSLVVIPGGLVYGLIREPGIRRGSWSWMAVAMAPFIGLSAVVSIILGLLLLIPVEDAPLAVRLLGLFFTVWGVAGIWITVTAIRKKRRLRQ